jgi:kumamolisin
MNVQLGGGQRVGYLTPVLYQNLAGSNPVQTVGAAGCTDVTSGNNNTAQVGGYSAGTGYDAVSGWGTPHGQNLFAAFRSTLAPPS